MTQDNANNFDNANNTNNTNYAYSFNNANNADEWCLSKAGASWPVGLVKCIYLKYFTEAHMLPPYSFQDILR